MGRLGSSQENRLARYDGRCHLFISVWEATTEQPPATDSEGSLSLQG
jgi:hypothetical protein